MRDLMKLMLVPAAVIALAAIVGLVGGVEQGTLSLEAAAFIAVGIVGIEIAAYMISTKAEEEEEHGKNPDE